MKDKIKNIIVFNPFGIGDVIFSTPIVRAIKNQIMDADITFIANKRVKFVLENNPFINRVLVYEKDDFRDMARKSKIKFFKEFYGFLKNIKKLNADLFIDLSLNYQASFMSMLLGVKKRIGFNYHNRGRFLTEKLPLEGFEKKHVCLYYLDILKLIGIKAENFYPETYTSKANDNYADQFIKNNNLEGKKIVGVIPGGGLSWGKNASYRRWPVNNFSDVSDKLAGEFKVSIVLFGDSNEADLCNQIEARVKHNVVNMGGKTNVGEFMALLKKCSFVICNEGGPLHIAVALGVPTVSIFGPVNELVYGPFATDMAKHIVVADRSKCEPCYSKFRHKKCYTQSCLHSLSQEKVLDAARKIFKGIKNGR